MIPEEKASYFIILSPDSYHTSIETPNKRSSLFLIIVAVQLLSILPLQPDMNQDDEVTSAHSHGETESKNIKQSKDQHDGATNEYDFDSEEKQVIGESAPLPELQRKLKSRHLSMIAIGKKAPCSLLWMA